MQTIKFDKVMPDVFNGQDLVSDIWNAQPTFERGKTYLVLADSGKGKSTFCSYILGYRKDYTGRIFFDDEDTRSFNIRKWSKIRCEVVSHLFQELRLFPELTAMENVEIKQSLANSVEKEIVKMWFRELGIDDKEDVKVSKMSFGQQQRVAMIRALVQPFDFIVVDEPISHLDDTNSTIMSEIMLNQAKKNNACVIVTSIGKHMDINYDKIYRL